ncbi:MAG: histidine kinase, partial [Lachnospiraceae bacterium]|nr:histidine kinase [Lachnospiraceae bacterium]
YIALIIPIVNAFLLSRIPWLSVVASAINVVPFAICLYIFVIAYSRELPHALPYGIGVLAVEISLLLYYSTRDMAVPSRFAYVAGYVVFSITIVSILAGEYALQYNEESKLSTELAKKLEAMQISENAFLNAQMKPHFLYNTLNTIADCCVTDSKKAQKLINSLSEFLKLILSLDNMDKTVPLRCELELAAAYTAIEKQRFPSINFYTDFPIKLPAIMMPPLTIQPLIENAIKHGVRKSDKPGVVTLRIVENPDSVQFFVSDNGKGMDEEAIKHLFRIPKDNQSIGIYNIDKRLKNLYDEGLTVESTPGLGTCVSFTVLKNV